MAGGERVPVGGVRWPRRGPGGGHGGGLPGRDSGVGARRRRVGHWGVLFLLVGHGVPREVAARAEEQVARLFALPAPDKARAGRRPGEPTATGYGRPPLALRFSKLMWSEGYTFRAATVREEFRPVWPDGGDDYLRFWYVRAPCHVLVLSCLVPSSCCTCYVYRPVRHACYTG